MCAWSVCFLVTAGVSLVTPRKPAAELAGLVYRSGAGEAGRDGSGMKGAWIFAGVVAVGLVILNWVFY
jgi:hypothetical protein